MSAFSALSPDLQAYLPAFERRHSSPRDWTTETTTAVRAQMDLESVTDRPYDFFKLKEAALRRLKAKTATEALLSLQTKLPTTSLPSIQSV